MAAVQVRQAYRFALDPTPAQQRMLCSHAGAARFAWNWGVARCRERYEAEGKWYSGNDLHKLWNAAKKADPALAWWSKNSKCVYQEAFRLTGAIRCSGFTVTLPRLGLIRTHEPTCKLARRLENGTARILSVTVSRTAQRWSASFTVEVERNVPLRHSRPGTAIGIDLGVSTLLTGVDSDGNVVTVAGPRALRTALRRLRRASRAHSRKVRGSANRRRSAARLARIHARVANVRTDALNKATTGLARRYETVVAEDLNVAGMIRNRALARAIADQGFGTARRLLDYKTAWHGGRLVVASRWFPSSKLCSGCGTVKAKLALSERTYRCESCDLSEDRDVNAARNLLHLAASGAERLNDCGGAVRPGSAGRAPLKQ